MESFIAPGDEAVESSYESRVRREYNTYVVARPRCISTWPRLEISSTACAFVLQMCSLRSRSTGSVCGCTLQPGDERHLRSRRSLRNKPFLDIQFGVLVIIRAFIEAV